jgi:hypothetical protein
MLFAADVGVGEVLDAKHGDGPEAKHLFDYSAHVRQLGQVREARCSRGRDSRRDLRCGGGLRGWIHCQVQDGVQQCCGRRLGARFG